jgi:hypothetical protein
MTVIGLWWGSRRRPRRPQETLGARVWQTPRLAVPAGLAQRGENRGGQETPAWPVGRLLAVVQPAGAPPVHPRTHLHIEPLAGGLGRIASVAPWPVGTGAGRRGATGGKGPDLAEPGHFRRRDGPAQPWGGALLLPHRRHLAVRVVRGRGTETDADGGRGPAAITGPRRAGNIHPRARGGRPAPRHRGGGAVGQRQRRQSAPGLGR